MKAASISELKQELANATQKELVALCLRLAKYKKENKELLSFLLFEANDLQEYINGVKKEIDCLFGEVNKSSLHFAKKTIRKILRITNKHIRYTASKEAEAELLIYFCTAFKKSGIKFHKSTALTNLYNAQIKKINAAIDPMHEDLAYEYKKQKEALLLL
jgi:hypothetical protein